MVVVPERVFAPESVAPPDNVAAPEMVVAPDIVTVPECVSVPEAVSVPAIVTGAWAAKRCSPVCSQLSASFSHPTPMTCPTNIPNITASTNTANRVQRPLFIPSPSLSFRPPDSGGTPRSVQVRRPPQTVHPEDNESPLDSFPG